jgi:type IV secretion system protein VirB9
MAYTVRFRYPNAGAGASSDDAPSASGEGRYRLGGDKALRPSEISDDGRHTYVRWPRDRALPAVYAISDTGQEMLVNGMMRDDVFVIDSVSQKLVFRIDKAVATAARVRVEK